MGTWLGKRAEHKSAIFVLVIFSFAFIGAAMSSGGYAFGEEAITGPAVKDIGEINFGFFGMIIAFVVFVAIVLVGYFAIFTNRSTHPRIVVKKSGANIPELRKVDKDIDSISHRLNEIDNAFSKKY